MFQELKLYMTGSPEYSRLQMLVEEMAEYGLEAKIEDFMFDSKRGGTSVLYRSYRAGAHGPWVPALTQLDQDAIIQGDENKALGNIRLIPYRSQYRRKRHSGSIRAS